MTDRERKLLRENEILCTELRQMQGGVVWIGLEEAARICDVGISTLRRWCADEIIDPRCGKKMGRKWKFRATVVLMDGIILK